MSPYLELPSPSAEQVGVPGRDDGDGALRPGVLDAVGHARCRTWPCDEDRVAQAQVHDLGAVVDDPADPGVDVLGVGRRRRRATLATTSWASGATPATPMPLSLLAATMPATWVPWPWSSWPEPSHFAGSPLRLRGSWWRRRPGRRGLRGRGRYRCRRCRPGRRRRWCGPRPPPRRSAGGPTASRTRGHSKPRPAGAQDLRPARWLPRTTPSSFAPFGKDTGQMVGELWRDLGEMCRRGAGGNKLWRRPGCTACSCVLQISEELPPCPLSPPTPSPCPACPSRRRTPSSAPSSRAPPRPAGFEGEGFPVRRAFAGVPLERARPVHPHGPDGRGRLRPGRAPGHVAGTPTAGFETVTYMLDGTFQHQDSHGGGGVITDGATQWMTAGGGILHIETPPEELVVSGGLFHGLQLWVNLPGHGQDDRAPLPEPRGRAGRAAVVARRRRAACGSSPARSTATPGPGVDPHADRVRPRHRRARARGCVLPWRPDFNALVYVLSGSGRVGAERPPDRRRPARRVRAGDHAAHRPPTGRAGRRPASR